MNDRELTKSERIDLGLAVLEASFPPGTCHTQEVIAIFCDCTIQTVRAIEHKALTKLRSQLRERDVNPEQILIPL